MFHLSYGTNYSIDTEAAIQVKENILNEAKNDTEVDISDGVAAEMFGILPSGDNEVRFHYVYIFQNSLVNVSQVTFLSQFL